MKEPCGDCVMEYGHHVCTMNCGPAVTRVKGSASSVQPLCPEPCPLSPDAAAQAAAVIDNTPGEYQAAAQALARLDWEALHTAMRVAQLCHKGQFDKGGEPYIWHVLRVGVKLLPDIDAAVAGVLHDVLEDCPLVTEAEVLYGAGGDREILTVLKLLKKGPGEDYGAYIKRAGSHPLARKVKLADLEDNLNPRRQELAARAVGADRILALRHKYEDAVVYLSRGAALFNRRPQAFPG